MNRTFVVALSLVVLVIVVDCTNEQKPAFDTPNVQYEVTDQGATLRIIWNPVADARGYYIYADGTVIDTLDHVTDTTYEATIPAGVYGVSVYSGDYVSARAEVNCIPIETANITVYGNSDPNPDHSSGIGFQTDGSCITLDITNPATHDDIDFYFDDIFFSMMAIVTPNMQPLSYNGEKNQTAASGTNYDGLNIALHLTEYALVRELIEDEVLSFWIDPNDDGWDAQVDHFGKMKIHSVYWSFVEPDSAVITVAYQLIPGLRWVVTD
jgi:hypothetical protein